MSRISIRTGLRALLAGVLLIGLPAQAADSGISALRVCADPGNMPLSNQNGEGYQNKIAKVLADSLGVPVQYDWRASTERGLIRGTLNANTCDVMFDMPRDVDMVLTTLPVYRSAFVLVYRNDRGIEIKDLDDPVLKQLKVGVYQMSSIRSVLARHDVKSNTVIHFISYDGHKVPENQPSYQVQHVVDGNLDVVGIWGPFAGFYKTIKKEPLTLLPVNLMDDSEPLEFDMALGVRRSDVKFRDLLEKTMLAEKDKIRAILEEFGVPLVECDDCIVSGDLPSHGPYEPFTETVEPEVAAAPESNVNLAQLKEWLAQGADKNIELHNAATAGDPVRVRYLVEQGADINRRDKDGITPLLTAARTPYPELARVLVELGADTELADPDGLTPLIYAAWRNSAETVSLLASSGVNLETANAAGLTALCLAAQHGRTKAVAALIAAGAEVDKAVGGGGYTPLMLAVAGGWEEAAAELVKGGANVNATNGAGITPLMIAAAGNRVETARLLLDAGAKIDVQGEDGVTALKIAEDREHSAVMEVLQKAASPSA